MAKKFSSWFGHLCLVLCVVIQVLCEASISNNSFISLDSYIYLELDRTLAVNVMHRAEEQSSFLVTRQLIRNLFTDTVFFFQRLPRRFFSCVGGPEITQYTYTYTQYIIRHCDCVLWDRYANASSKVLRNYFLFPMLKIDTNKIIIQIIILYTNIPKFRRRHLKLHMFTYKTTKLEFPMLTFQASN